MPRGHYKGGRLREGLPEKVTFTMRWEDKQKLLEKEVRWSKCPDRGGEMYGGSSRNGRGAV